MGAKAADDDHIPMILPETGGTSGPGPAAPSRSSQIGDRGWKIEEPLGLRAACCRFPGVSPLARCP